MSKSTTARPAGTKNHIAVLAMLLSLFAVALPGTAFTATPASTPMPSFGFTSDPEAGDPYPRALGRNIPGFSALKAGTCVVHGLMAEGGPGSGSRIKVTVEGLTTDQIVPLVTIWPETRPSLEELDALLATVGVKRVGSPLYFTRGTGGGNYQDWLRQVSTCPPPAPTDVAQADVGAWTAFLTGQGLRPGDVLAYQAITWAGGNERKLYAAKVTVIELNGGLRLSVEKSGDAVSSGGLTDAFTPWSDAQMQAGLGVPEDWVSEKLAVVTKATADPSGSSWFWIAMPRTQLDRINAPKPMPAPAGAPVYPVPPTAP